MAAVFKQAVAALKLTRKHRVAQLRILDHMIADAERLHKTFEVTPKQPRHRISAAGKRRIAAGQKARWAKWRKSR